MSDSALKKRAKAKSAIIGDGDMAKRIRDFDWTQTSLGAIERWPPCLVTTVNLILQSPLAMAILWGEEGFMVYNDAYSLIAGRRHPELLGSKVTEGWPENAEFNRHVMEVVLAGGTLRYIDRRMDLIRNDVPEEAYFNLAYSPVVNEQGAILGTLAYVVETTDRVRIAQKRGEAEKRLREQRKRLQLIFQHAPAMLAIFQGKDLKIEMANAQFIATFALGRDIIGKPLFKVVPELNWRRGDKLLEGVLETGEPLVGVTSPKLDWYGNGKPEEKHFKFAAISLSDVPNGRPDRIFLHAVDITDQVDSKRKAEELSLLLEAVFDSLPDGLLIAQGDKVTHINQRGAETFGFTSADQVPHDLCEIYQRTEARITEDGEVIVPERSTIELALKGERVSRVGMQAINVLTGDKQVLRTAGVPIRDKAGKVIGAVAVYTDLTEMYELQRQVQQEEIERQLLIEKANMLKERNEQLTQLTMAKDEFIALTSHQLRTPATGVKQYISMLMQGYVGELTPDQHEFLERAYESNEQQLYIIEEILRVAKVDMGRTRLRKQRTDIGKLVRDVLDEQQERFSQQWLRLSTEFPDKPIWLSIDPIQIRMAVGNIVDNAIKYTPQNKKISIRVWRRDHEHVSIAVKDEGVGIADEDLDKLFLKFSRIPNSMSVNVSGTGLGLYWTKRMIELHGGKVTVASKIGKGTTFTVSLPLK